MKQDWAAAAKWEAEEIGRLGIEFHLNTPVTPKLIEQFAPDRVIIATGSEDTAPAIPGIDGPNVYTQYAVSYTHLPGLIPLSIH